MSDDSVRLNLMHCSMQFSDSKAQKVSDAAKIFERAARRDVDWVTGTEAGAGSEDTKRALKAAATEHGYRWNQRGGSDCWVAVKGDLIHSGSRTVSFELVIPGEAKKHTNLGVLKTAFDTDLGRITVLASHYPTKGRPEAPRHPNLEKNQRMAEAIGRNARDAGAGSNLVFYAGDQNISDKASDTFFGEPLLSAWDELGVYENTGHGNIDVIASYNADRRVRAAYIRALDDKEFVLHSDHFLVEAGFDVRVLPSGKK